MSTSFRPTRCGAWCVVCCAVIACAGNPADGIAAGSDTVIRLDADATSPGYGSITISGFNPDELARLERLGDDDWSPRFMVFTADAAPVADRPPMLGRHVVEETLVRFVPDYPLIPGETYVARWFGNDGTVELEAQFALPRSATASTTTVRAVYPTIESIPENLLKLYVHFSAPMSRGEAVRRIRLLDEAGDALPLPWVAPEHELWSPGTDRLTLFFDPGRIKQGVGPNLELGPPLSAGNTYRLVIDAAWNDARGTPLVAAFEKTLRVTEADRVSPRHAEWRITAPTASDDAVTLQFEEPLDHALLERMLEVVDADDRSVDGRIRITDAERSWSLTPRDGWSSGDYAIIVDPGLTDLAGNSLQRPFDSPIGTAAGERRPIRLTFRYDASP